MENSLISVEMLYCIGQSIEIPEGLKAFMQREKQSYPLSNDVELFKKALWQL